MTIEFKCSGCGNPLRLPDEMGGLRAQCIHCNEVFTIPSATEHFWPPGFEPPQPQQTSGVKKPSQSPAGRSGIHVRSHGADSSAPAGAAPAANSVAETIHYSVAETAVIARAEPANSIPASAKPASEIFSGPKAAKPVDFHAAPKTVRTKSLGSAGAALAETRPIAPRPVPLQDSTPEPEIKPPVSAVLEVRDVLGRAWGIYKNNFAALAVAGVTIVLVAGASNLAITFGLNVMRAPSMLMALLPQVLLIWLMLGTMSFLFKIARGRRASVADLFGEMPLFGHGIMMWVLCFVPAWLAAGLAMLVGVPLWIVAMALTVYSFLASWMFWTPALLGLVDRHALPLQVPIDTLRYVRRNWLQLIALLAVALGVIIAGCLPLGLGLPLAIPFALLVATVAYLRDGRARQVTSESHLMVGDRR
jgi:hypothetical protein